LQDQLKTSEIENYNLKIENKSLNDHFRVMNATNEEFVRMLNQSKEENCELKQENELLKGCNQRLVIETQEVRLMLRNKTIQIQNFEDKLEEEQSKYIEIMKNLKEQDKIQLNGDDDTSLTNGSIPQKKILRKRRAKSLISFVPLENQQQEEIKQNDQILFDNSPDSIDSLIYGHVTIFLWSTPDLEEITMKHVFNYVFKHISYENSHDKILMKKKIRQMVRHQLKYI
jgi:hypothetical protein